MMSKIVEAENDVALGIMIDNFNSLLIGELLARSGNVDKSANEALKRLRHTLIVADTYINAAKDLKNF